jgi:hypothetical protein
MTDSETDFERYKLALAQQGRRVSALVMPSGSELTDTGHTNGRRQFAVTLYFTPDGALKHVSNPFRAWWRINRTVPLLPLLRRR